MITVVITCCQADVQFLPRAIASVEWQLSPDDELIVVTDGVYDTSIDDLCLNPDSRARIIRNSQRRGVSYARNEGYLNTENPWIKFLDVDDLLAPFALEGLRRVLPKTPSDIAVVVGGQYIVHNGVIQGLRQPTPDFVGWIKRANPFLVSHTVIRRSALEVAGRFDERIHFEEDWDLWLRIHNEHGASAFGFTKLPLCFYTIDDERRRVTEQTRDHTVEGIDVREYFKRVHGAEPEAVV